MFVATATSWTHPPALRDRLEVLELPGYTREEKLNISKQFLIPKQLEEHGLTPTGHLRGRGRRRNSSTRTRARPACATSSARRNVIRPSPCSSPKARPRPSRRSPSSSSPSFSDRKHISEVAEARPSRRRDGPGLDARGGDILFIEATR